MRKLVLLVCLIFITSTNALADDDPQIKAKEIAEIYADITTSLVQLDTQLQEGPAPSSDFYTVKSPKTAQTLHLPQTSLEHLVNSTSRLYLKALEAHCLEQPSCDVKKLRKTFWSVVKRNSVKIYKFVIGFVNGIINDLWREVLIKSSYGLKRYGFSFLITNALFEAFDHMVLDLIPGLQIPLCKIFYTWSVKLSSSVKINGGLLFSPRLPDGVDSSVVKRFRILIRRFQYQTEMKYHFNKIYGAIKYANRKKKKITAKNIIPVMYKRAKKVVMGKDFWENYSTERGSLALTGDASQVFSPYTEVTALRNLLSDSHRNFYVDQSFNALNDLFEMKRYYFELLYHEGELSMTALMKKLWKLASITTEADRYKIRYIYYANSLNDLTEWQRLKLENSLSEQLASFLNALEDLQNDDFDPKALREKVSFSKGMTTDCYSFLADQ